MVHITHTHTHVESTQFTYVRLANDMTCSEILMIIIFVVVISVFSRIIIMYSNSSSLGA